MKKFEDDVPTEVKKRRNRELLAIQQEASAAVHAKYVGRTLPVFVESVSRKHEKARATTASINAADPRVTLGWATQGDSATALADSAIDPRPPPSPWFSSPPAPSTT